MSLCDAKNAFFDGRDIGDKGGSRRQNPHPPGTEDYLQWDRGWRQGCCRVLTKKENTSTVIHLLGDAEWLLALNEMISFDKPELRQEILTLPLKEAFARIQQVYNIQYPNLDEQEIALILAVRLGYV